MTVAIPPKGSVIAGRYRVRDLLGDGATGVVVRADDPSGQVVALKLLSRELAKDPAASKRFAREARALAELAHPHVVRVLDCGITDDGRAYLVTELLHGEGLDVRIRRSAPSPEEALRLTESLLAGLSYVHQHGILHRDLKPQNLFVAQERGVEVLKLLDFGLAKFGERAASGPASIITQEGAVLGTPGYMAPEQAFGGGVVDARADVYAAGAIVFELFAGRPVFVENDPASLLRAHMLEPIPKLGEARAGLVVQPELDEVLATALSKSVEGRFVDGRVFDVALSHVPRPVARLI